MKANIRKAEKNYEVASLAIGSKCVKTKLLPGVMLINPGFCRSERPLHWEVAGGS